MLKRFLRRWRYARACPYFVKPIKIVWKLEDSQTMKSFLHGETGHKTLVMIDDLILNATFNCASKDYLDGLTDIRQYLVELGSPKEASDPRLDEEDENWRIEE